MRRTLTLIMCAVLFAMTAEAQPAPPRDEANRPTVRRDDWRIGADLVRTRWRLEAMEGRQLDASSAPTLEFLRDLQVRGSTGCRRYVGPFASRADKGVFGPLRTSEDACDMTREAQEALYLERLQAAWRMRLEGEGRVLLAYPRPGAEPLRFIRLP